MLTPYTSKLINISVLLLLFLSIPLHAAEKDTLVVGRLMISSAAEKMDDIQQRAEAIVSQMSGLGISKVKVLEFHGISQMIDALNNGEVDWITDTLFPALIYAEYTNADIFEQRFKSGLPKFYSVFFVRKNSDLDSVDNLERKTLSFGNAFSSGSYFAPYYELHEKRYTLVRYGAKLDDDIVGKRRIYYKFAINENEIANNVINVKADIGVMSNFDYAALPAEQKEQIRIIHNTAAFVHYVEVVRGDLDLVLKKRLKQLILEQNEKIEKPILPVDNDRTTRFYKFVGEGRDGFVYMRSLVEHGTIPVLIEKKEKQQKKSYFY